MQIRTNKIEQDGRYIRIDCGSRFKASLNMEKLEKAEEYTVKIEKCRKHRSLDANAYFWTLCGQLAAKLRIPKTEIYKQLIKEIGDNFIIAEYKVEDVHSAINYWQSHGIGWVSEVIGRTESRVQVIQYLGSSEYDTTQMSRLIDLLIEECKEQGIDTMSDRERSLLIEAWGE